MHFHSLFQRKRMVWVEEVACFLETEKLIMFQIDMKEGNSPNSLDEESVVDSFASLELERIREEKHECLGARDLVSSMKENIMVKVSQKKEAEWDGLALEVKVSSAESSSRPSFQPSNV